MIIIFVCSAAGLCPSGSGVSCIPCFGRKFHPNFFILLNSGAVALLAEPKKRNGLK